MNAVGIRIIPILAQVSRLSPHENAYYGSLSPLSLSVEGGGSSGAAVREREGGLDGEGEERRGGRQSPPRLHRRENADHNSEGRGALCNPSNTLCSREKIGSLNYNREGREGASGSPATHALPRTNKGRKGKPREGRRLRRLRDRLPQGGGDFGLLPLLLTWPRPYCCCRCYLCCSSCYLYSYWTLTLLLLPLHTATAAAPNLFPSLHRHHHHNHHHTCPAYTCLTIP